MVLLLLLATQPGMPPEPCGLGFEAGTRENVNGQDLNRDFPDQFDPPGSVYRHQTETRLIMDFSRNHTFVMSANFHGGSLVANYPWDGVPHGQVRPGR